MAVEELPIPPFCEDIDSIYSGDEFSLPFRDLVGEGVVGTGHFAVSQRGAGANMSVDVAAGRAWVEGDEDTSAQPTYQVKSTSIVNVAIAAADGSNARIDRVVLRVEDDTFDGSNERRAVLETLEGTPAGSPSAPAEPDNAITLALVSVPASDTTITNAQITDMRERARVAGGAVLLAEHGASHAVDGDDPVPFAVVPAARVVFDTWGQSLAHASETAVQFTAEELDTDGLVDLGSHNTRVTASRDGVYSVSAAYRLIDPGALNFLSQRLRLRKNGSTFIADVHDEGPYPAVDVGCPSMSVSTHVALEAGDYLELLASYLHSGGASSILFDDTEGATFMSVAWLGLAA